MTKLFVVIFVVSAIFWGVSKADDSGYQDILSFITGDKPPVEILPKPIGLFGTVESINDQELQLDSPQSLDYTGLSSFVVDLSKVGDVKDQNGTVLTLADVKVGDSIISSGFLNGDNLAAESIVLFTSDDDLSTTSATSTDQVATSTEDTTDQTPDLDLINQQSTTTPVDNISTSSDEVIGTSTEATSTETDDSVASSSEDTSVAPTPTSTSTIDDTATST